MTLQQFFEMVNPNEWEEEFDLGLRILAKTGN
jgi:hypothetical protein